jgi:hypothetical protein
MRQKLPLKAIGSKAKAGCNIRETGMTLPQVMGPEKFELEATRSIV